MTYTYWFVAPVMTFYTIFGLEGTRYIGVIIIVVLIFIGLLISYCKSGMRFRSWYHEILLCGVDKLSMSITILSNSDGSRSWWMIIFELWFAFMVKFFIPTMMMWMMFRNLYGDLDSPYGGHSNTIQLIGFFYFIVAVFIIIIPFFVCGYPELFTHDVNLEFIADQIYSDALQKQNLVGVDKAADVSSTELVGKK